MIPPHPEPAALDAADTHEWGRPRRGRVFLWAALMVLLLAAQTLLVALAFHYRSTRTQEKVEENAGAASAELGQLLAKDLQQILALPGADTPCRALARACGAVAAGAPRAAAFRAPRCRPEASSTRSTAAAARRCSRS